MDEDIITLLLHPILLSHLCNFRDRAVEKAREMQVQRRNTRKKQTATADQHSNTSKSQKGYYTKESKKKGYYTNSVKFKKYIVHSNKFTQKERSQIVSEEKDRFSSWF